jgi:hypothetical protein
VVSWLVVGDVARRYDEEHGYEVQPLSDAAYKGNATEAKLPVPPFDGKDTRPPLEVERVYGDWLAAVSVMSQHTTPAEPTEADKHDIYQQAIIEGSLPSDTTYEQIADKFNLEQVAPLLGLRNELRDTAKARGLTVNPRYRPLVMSLNGIPLPLGSATDAL